MSGSKAASRIGSRFFVACSAFEEEFVDCRKRKRCGCSIASPARSVFHGGIITAACWIILSGKPVQIFLFVAVAVLILAC